MNDERSINSWLDYAKDRPHEFTIQYPQDPEYFRVNFKQTQYDLPTYKNKKELLLYFHIPFCEHKCSYCNFAVDLSKNIYGKYVDALLKEFDYTLNNININSVVGIDIGGGTPTLLPTALLEKIVFKISDQFNDNSINFKSIETTPQIAAFEKEKIQLIKNAGFSRISIGLQSANNTVKSIVNRKSDNKIDFKAINNIHNCNIERINIDLIFGLPAQTEQIWLEDIKFAVSLSPSSITIYDCLYSRENRKIKIHTLPAMAFYGKLYDIGYEYLISNGYHAIYGSENFSKIKNETGTSTYFEGRILKGLPYIGLGNYATSQLDDIWWFNLFNSRKYIDAIDNSKNQIQDYYKLPNKELMAKFILGNLNYGQINSFYFYTKFGVKLEEVFEKEFAFLLNHNLMKKNGNEWQLQTGKFYKISTIKSLFYTNGMKVWMMNNTNKNI